MMKLSTMLAIDATLDPNWRSPIADTILTHWPHDPGTAHFYRASANFIFTFDNAGQRHFLRFTHSTDRTRAAIEAETTLLTFLAAKGTPVATPIPSNQSRLVETIATDLGTFHAVVFPALQGTQHEIEDLTPAQFETWGAALGQLHATMALCHDPSLSARTTLQDQLATLHTYIPTNQPRVQAEYHHLTTFLTTLPITPTSYGLIHGDFELDNLFWQDNTLALLDFDECTHAWYIMDIALALRDLFNTDPNLNTPAFHAFLHGYRTHHPLDDQLLPHLPTFLRLTKLLTYAKLQRSLDLPQDQTYPDWCISLQTKLQNVVQNYKTSLA